MTAPHTLAFLDVDGTIGPLGTTSRTLAASGWADWTTVKASGMEVLVADGLVAALRGIAALPGVEVRWLTDWAEDAHELGLVLGLGPFAVAGGRSDLDGFDYKSAAILRDLEHSGVDRFVWLDDNAPGHSRDLTAEEHEALASTLTAAEYAVHTAGTERLIIAPEAAVGLTRADVQAIEVFCQR